jgi:O-antigen ligase
MKMPRLIYRLSLLDPRIEFLSILSWLLFFPAKDSPFYFLVFSTLIALISLRNIYFMKNLSFSAFSYFLMGFNALLIFSVFFSLYRFQSILFITDIMLISLYFVLFFLDRRNEDSYFHLLAYLISILSLVKVIHTIIPFSDSKTIFFSNLIFQGAASGIAAIIVFYYLLKKFDWLLLTLLAVNMAGVFLSESKSAYIGTALIVLVMVLLKKKKLIPVVLIFILLTFVTPNPIKRMFVFSLTKDPYSANRIDMWKMSLDMFKDHFLWGVGPDNFSTTAKRYNFKQTNGPANYYKLPSMPHNDYLKILAETGIPGLLFLLLLGWALSRKILSSPLFNLSKLLILYFLFQAFVFDLIFHIFFFFIFIFLLKNLFERELIHKSFTLNSKVYSAFLLVFILLVGYWMPFISFRMVERANKGEGITFVTRFELLNRAGKLNPLNPMIHYYKALALTGYFKEMGNLEAFYSVVEDVKQAQRLNPYFIEAYRLESDLYDLLLKKHLNYSGLSEEIVAPLEKAEKYDPLNPFIKLRKAEVYFNFNRDREARETALEALVLEPEFAAALFFIQKNFHFFPDEEEFKIKIDKIRRKAERLEVVPGTYLYKLFQIPGE